MKKWLGFFSSMKVGLALLAVFGMYAAAGSALQPETYMHTPLFAFLGLLVTANMLVCTGRQFYLLAKAVHKGAPGPPPRRAALAFLHLGILVVLIGVLMSGGREMVRFGRYVGDTVELSDVSRRAAGTLSFRDLSLELDESGRILQYRAELRCDGKDAVLQVNQPLRLGRGRLLFGEYLDSVTVRIRENGEESEAKIGSGDSIPFRSDAYRAVLLRYVPDYSEDDWMSSAVHRGETPRLVFQMGVGEEPMALYVAEFGDTIPLGEDCRFRFTETEPFVVFAYSYDPGSVPVAAGAVLMLISLGVWMLLREQSGKKNRKEKE